MHALTGSGRWASRGGACTWIDAAGEKSRYTPGLADLSASSSSDYRRRQPCPRYHEEQFSAVMEGRMAKPDSLLRLTYASRWFLASYDCGNCVLYSHRSHALCTRSLFHA